MTAPYFAEHDVTLWQGDAAEVLAKMPAESVNCVVTSPPYFGLRDYGHDGQIGLEPSPAEYVAALVAVFAQVKRVLRDDGVLWLNLGDSYVGNGSPGGMSKTLVGASQRLTSAGKLRPKPGVPKNLMGMPWRVAFALQDDGWTLRNSIIWHKPNAMPESVTDRLSGRHENVFLLSKRARYWFDLDPIREWSRDSKESDVPGQSMRQHRSSRGSTATSRGGIQPGNTMQRDPAANGLGANPLGKNPGDVWSIPTAPYSGAHFAVMPPEVVRRCILAGCPTDGTVLDPFSGSGTTAMVARQLGRKAVGIELNPDYLALSTQRIGDTPFDFGGAA